MSHLADYASDSYQETPTAAAVRAVPDFRILRQDILNLDISINKVLNRNSISNPTKTTWSYISS